MKIPRSPCCCNTIIKMFHHVLANDCCNTVIKILVEFPPRFSETNTFPPRSETFQRGCTLRFQPDQLSSRFPPRSRRIHPLSKLSIRRLDRIPITSLVSPFSHSFYHSNKLNPRSRRRKLERTGKNVRVSRAWECVHVRHDGERRNIQRLRVRVYRRGCTEGGEKERFVIDSNSA